MVIRFQRIQSVCKNDDLLPQQFHYCWGNEYENIIIEQRTKHYFLLALSYFIIVPQPYSGYSQILNPGKSKL